ncbi:hypothetical protein Afil01_11330 [Actinorhabdospora filicis]|uniref:NACHT domain-containing protein n=1 Tax=Actinorhabdospora filicis TaxID=1785913 RepID=A0A9W6W8C0_9ACTN|nr:pentapeptide repeat-containing protein [Actinorhabdospora filicis]GLZ76326.1 hypothetical protein Afil01_11330 [Actinorhabdospora filicis]
MRPPEHAVAIVLNSEGRQAGLAFLIGPRELATCAHVVDTALGRKRGTRSTPEGPVRLRLPFGPGSGETTAAVTGWFRGEDGADLDLALLTVPPGAADGIVPLPLARQADTGIDVQMCGPADDGRLIHVRGLLVGRSGQGRLQIDQSRGGAYRVEPGYSGGPVWRQSTGEVVGVLRAVAVGASAAECLDVALLHRIRSGRHPDAKPSPGAGHPTVLQLGGTRFAGEDGPEAETLAEQVLADLARLEHDHDARPNLLVVCGNLTANARPREFDVARRYLSALAEPLGLTGEQIVVVPGPSDVNATLCRAYFEQCRELDEEPVAPYWEKWRPYSNLLTRVTGRPLPRAEPWLAHDLGDPAVIVTALNSTFGVTHLPDVDEPVYGDAQLRWITARAQESGAVPHVVVSHRALVPAPTRSPEIRRAARLVGPVADLILAGEEGVPGLDRRGMRPVLTVSSRRRFHVVRLDPERTEVFARRRDGGRFVGDTGTDPDGENWRFGLRRRSSGPKPATAEPPPPSPSRPMENLRLVAEAAELRDPDAVFEITEPVAGGMEETDDGDGGFAYLRVITRHDFGNGLEPTGQYLLGVLNGPPCRHVLDRFHREVVALFRSPGSAPLTRVIYFGKLATAKAVSHGRGLGMHVESFLQFQRGWDPRPFVAWQETDLATDPRYPPQLYVPQDYRELGPRGMPVPSRDADARPTLPERVAGWLREPYGHLIVVLGAAGSGKTFFLRTLARELSDVDSPVTPIYLPVRELGRLPEINEVVAAYLTRAGEERLSTTRFEYLLREGRIALLLDGLDELTALSTYERAIGHLREIGSRAEHLAKIVVTARDVGFLSNTTVLDALGGASAVTEGRRALQISAFSAEQIEMFLTRLLGDREAARRRVRLISGLGELPEVARNPRMLSFIAAIDERRLIEAQEAGEGQLTGADLYRQVLDQWITGEIVRLARPGQPPPLSKEQLWLAVRALAQHLWRTEREYITIQGLGVAASTLSHLDDLDPPRPEHDGQIHQLGAGSLLVRHEDAELGFIHRSIREWLVADALTPLGDYHPISPLAHHRLTGQAAQFLCEMNDKAAVWSWIDGFSRDQDATDEGRDNALLLQRFAGPRVLSPPPAEDLFVPGDDRQFIGARLSGRDLRDQDLMGYNLSYAHFIETDFTGGNLRGTFWTESDLTEAKLTLTDLTDAHLEETDLTGADLMGANLTRARFDEARMRRAKLLGATMTDVRLHNADLTGAALPGEPLSVQLRPSMVGDVAALDPGGQLVATGDAQGWVRLWELQSGRPVRQWRVLGGPIVSLDWSPDGRRLLVAGRGLGVADAVHGGVQSTRDDVEVIAAAWSPVPGRYAMALAGGGVTIESADNRDEGHLCLPDVTATRLAWSPDGDRLAAATYEGLAVVRPSGDENEVYAAESPITSLAWSPDGLHVATGHADGRVETWRVPAFRRHDAQSAHTGAVTALAWSPDGRQLYSAGSDRRVLEWQSWTLSAGRTIPTLVKDVRSLLYATDSRILVTCGGPGVLHAWNLDENRPCWEGTAGPQWINTASWSPDGRYALTGASDGELRVWDLSTGLTARSNRAEGSILATDWSRDGERIITGSDNGETLLWDRDLSIRPSFNRGAWVWATRWSPDGTHFATGGDDQLVRVWTRAHHEPVRRWRVPGRIRALAWSPDSHNLIIGDATGGLACRHVRDGGLSWRVAGEGNAITALCVSAAGIILITGDSADQICIRSAETGEDYDRRTAGHGRVTAISWNDETHTFHTAGDDGRIRVWSTGGYTVIQEWQAHAGPVTSMSLSPDGRHLLTTGRDNVVRVWLADTGDPVATLLPLRNDTEAVFYGDGLRYKLTGNTDGRFWYACAQVRLEAGEADEYVHELERVAEDTPLL